MDYILELSRKELSNPVASTSKVPLKSQAEEPSYLSKPRLQARLGSLAQEIASIENSIVDLQRIRAELLREHINVKKELNALDSHRGGMTLADSVEKKEYKVVVGQSSQIDYMDEFEWSGPLKATMKSVFGIEGFRLCQEGCSFPLYVS